MIALFCNRNKEKHPFGFVSFRTHQSTSVWKAGIVRVKNANTNSAVQPSLYACAEPYHPGAVVALDSCFGLVRLYQSGPVDNTEADVKHLLFTSLQLRHSQVFQAKSCQVQINLINIKNEGRYRLRSNSSGILLQYVKFKTYKTLGCLLYTSPSPRDLSTSRMPSSA